MNKVTAVFVGLLGFVLLMTALLYVHKPKHLMLITRAHAYSVRP